MDTIDIIIGLLDAGKGLYDKDRVDNHDNLLGENSEAIMKIVDLINRLTGFERPEVVTNYITGKTNLANTILRLVVDERKELFTPIHIEPLPGIESNKPVKNEKVVPMRKRKRSRRGKYDKRVCIDALHKISIHLGKSFTRMDYIRYTRDHKGYPNVLTVVKYVGGPNASWDDVLLNAGLKSNSYRAAE